MHGKIVCLLTYERLIFTVIVSKYTIHGAPGGIYPTKGPALTKQHPEVIGREC